MSGARGDGECRSASAAEEAFYGSSLEVVSPTSYDDLADVIRSATEKKRLIIPAGLGRHAYVGNLPAANGVPAEPLIVSMQHFSDVLRYEPADFTVGVQAGTRLEDLQDVLAENGQEISIDWTRASAGTVGGAVAVGLDGPRRGSAGTYRSFIIGNVGMRGTGVIYKTGGMVVKNVAGYDVGKLLVGSLGTLGVILEVNFKLYPIARAHAVQACCFESRGAAESFLRSFRDAHLEPSSISILDPAAATTLATELGASLTGWTILWVFEGNSQSVRHLEQQVSKLSSSDALPALSTLDEALVAPARQWLTDFDTTADPTEDGLAIVRFSTLPTRVFDAHHAFSKALERTSVSVSFLADSLSGVCLSRLEGTNEALGNAIDKLKNCFAELGCNARLVFASPGIRQKHSYLLHGDANRALAQRIQDVFDPGRIFHPGRVSPTPPH